MDTLLHRTGQTILWSGIGLIFFGTLWTATLLASRVLDLSPS